MLLKDIKVGTPVRDKVDGKLGYVSVILENPKGNFLVNIIENNKVFSRVISIDNIEIIEIKKELVTYPILKKYNNEIEDLNKKYDERKVEIFNHFINKYKNKKLKIFITDYELTLNCHLVEKNKNIYSIIEDKDDNTIYSSENEPIINISSSTFARFASGQDYILYEVKDI